MNPLPAETPALTSMQSEVPSLLPSTFSASNRRAHAGSSHSYAWLLFASTAVAGLFCFMYITKPIVATLPSPPAVAVPTQPALSPTPAPHAPAKPEAVLVPNSSQLPGEIDPPPLVRYHPRNATPPTSSFEETNLRIQHVLSAEAPGGQVARIDLEVPVLYQSRQFRWTSTEVAEARSLLTRLTEYQEKSQALRIEGVELLESWNRLVSQSIPAAELRADSPTLPANQLDASDAPRPAALRTPEFIQIQSAGK